MKGAGLGIKNYQLLARSCSQVRLVSVPPLEAVFWPVLTVIVKITEEDYVGRVPCQFS